MPHALLQLAVPGEGPVAEALSTIQQLCLQMKEARPACSRLHRRLRSLLDELRRMETEGQLPSVDSLDKYTATVTEYLRFLQLNQNSNLIYRVAMHKEMKDELKRLNDDVAELFVELLDVEAVGWEKQWEEDCAVQEAVLSATTKDKAVVHRDLQTLRAQTEAWLTLKYEAEEFAEDHDEVCLQWMKSMMKMIAAAPGFSEVELPDWFAPACQGEYEAQPFGTGPCGSVHYETQDDHDKAVAKFFRVDDGVIDECAQRKIEKELDLIFEMDHVNVAKMLCGSHVSSPPFVIHRFAHNGNLRSFLSRSEENKRKMWRLLYQAALGLEHIHSKDVAHGSLKLSNILVNAEGDAQLAGFGLHTLRMCVNLSTKPPRDLLASNVRWLAPECLEGQPTVASDVYSFAMCIVEAVTEAPPYAPLSGEDARKRVESGEMPDKPGEMTDDVWRLVVSMTDRFPEKRIPLSKVLEKLQTLADWESAGRSLTDITCGGCSATISVGSRFCANCGVPVISTLEIAQRDPQRATLDRTCEKSVEDLISTILVGDTDEQEQALLCLYQKCYSDDQRMLMYDSNGVSVLIDIVKNGRTHFTQVCALGCLNWADKDSRLLTPELVSLRDLVHAATADECTTIATMRQGNNEEKIKAAAYCTCIAATYSKNALRNGGVVATLIELLVNGGELEKLWSVSALGHLANNDTNRLELVRDGAAAPVIAAIGASHGMLRERSVWALSQVSATKACCSVLSAGGAVSSLITLLRDGGYTEKHHAACVLANIASSCAANRRILVTEGVIPVLSVLLRRGTDLQKGYAMRAVGGLTVDKDNHGAIMSGEIVTSVVKILSTGSDAQKLNAALALGNLTIAVSNVGAITRAGVISPLVTLLL